MTKNQPAPRAIRARWSPARPVVITLWILLLVLSVYQAQAIRDEIDKNEVLRKQRWLRDAITAVMRFGDAIGMSKLRDELGGIRTKVNRPYLVLEAEDTIDELDGHLEPGLADSDPNAGRHLVARRPRRVLVIGASSIQFAIGVELEKGLPRDYDQVKVKRFGQLATGLSRPDFMNWPEKLRELAKSFRPDLVICNFGGNDAQSIPQGGYGQIAYESPEWETKYAERVTEIIDIAREHGADTVMIGMPIMRSPKFSKKMRRLNRVMKAATEAAGMLFVPTYRKASTADGTYRKTVEFRGKRGLMRTSDGVHYTRLGARYMIEQVLQRVERRYRLEPKDATLASVQRHGFESTTLNRPTWYTAYVPRSSSDTEATMPAVVLLPDGDDWASWPSFPHRRLQRWAQDRKIVLVVPEGAHRTAYVGPLASVLRDELPRDLKRHLPVARVAYAGSGRGAVSALAAGTKSLGLLLYRPWYDPSKHAADPALVEALGEPAANTGGWGSNGWAQPNGPPVWLQAGPQADALRRSLGGRVRDAGQPAQTFVAALEQGLAMLVPAPPKEPAPEARVPR